MLEKRNTVRPGRRTRDGRRRYDPDEKVNATIEEGCACRPFGRSNWLTLHGSEVTGSMAPLISIGKDAG